ncbi:hypothetical protein [Pedomonas sp. V897]
MSVLLKAFFAAILAMVALLAAAEIFIPSLDEMAEQRQAALEARRN